MHKGVGFAVASYAIYAVAVSARLYYLFLLPIIFYSPILGFYSFLEAYWTKSMKRGLSLLFVALLLFDALVATDGLLRGFLFAGFVLFELLPLTAGMLFLWVLAGLLWSGKSVLNTQFNLQSLSLSRVLSIVIVLAGFFLWFSFAWIPLLGVLFG